MGLILMPFLAVVSFRPAIAVVVRVKQQAESDQMAKEHSELLVPAGGTAANQSQIAAAA